MASKTPKVDINPKILTWARSNLGYTEEEFAKKIKIKESVLKAWESGTDKPSFAQLRKLADCLKRPTSIFLLDEVPAAEPLPKDFRVLDESDIKKLSADTVIEIRKAQRKRQLAIDLTIDLGEEAPTFTGKASTNDDVVTLAARYRKALNIKIEDQIKWQNDYQAFNTWKREIENYGVLIFQASLDSLDEMRGLAIYAKQLPLILLNTKDSPRGKLFSLLHEFCHLLLHQSGIGNVDANWETKGKYNSIEVFCNAFAAEMLLPLSEFKRVSDSQSISNQNTIRALANKFKVSGEVILRRALDAEFFSRAVYKKVRSEYLAQFEKTKKKTKPANVPVHVKAISYNGDAYTSLVLAGVERERITLGDVIDYLDVSYKHLDKIREEITGRNKGA